MQLAPLSGPVPLPLPSGQWEDGGGKGPPFRATEVAKVHCFFRLERPAFCARDALFENPLFFFFAGLAALPPQSLFAFGKDRQQPLQAAGRFHRPQPRPSERPPFWMRDAPFVFRSSWSCELRDADQMSQEMPTAFRGLRSPQGRAVDECILSG
ncbi:hypothetical protein NDU88_007210 [Pleurodeles waltl]|uniref:Uncharacterized protein n=1 Tax=Pleurodeles waltl TaxID=8319 RepID=A0AAV7QN24_PLEWA|nr:hypothetical protein NDU88_007210 [Pleurodeles waltl]